MSDHVGVPRWLTVAREIMGATREVIGLALVIASLVTAGALWATTGVRSDVASIKVDLRALKQAVELLATVSSDYDSVRVAAARRQLQDMRRVIPPGVAP